MNEFYSITVTGSSLSFAKQEAYAPEYAVTSAFDPAKSPKDISIVCRMGSPDELHCVIFRFDGKAGGIFALHDQSRFMFAAQAESELAFTLAKGFFGELVANAHTGVDIFENPEGSDD